MKIAKKKKNPNKIIFTQGDMKIAEKKWEQQLQDMKIQATSDATAYVQAVAFLALMRMGVDIDFIVQLQDGMNKISDRILDDPEYSFENVKEELLEFGIEL